MSNSEPPPLPPSGSIPSSFDSEPDFFNESRFQKLWRKLRQEPLIPLGCAATCYALYMATKSIRAGDKHQTNRMFRARIYAQGFTLLALVAGSIFYKDERLKRKKFEDALEEKKAGEKKEKWLRELEARDEEEKKWREGIEKQYVGNAATTLQAAQKQVVDVAEKTKGSIRDADKALQGEAKKGSGWWFSSKSVSEEVRRQGWGPGWANRTRDAWRRF